MEKVLKNKDVFDTNELRVLVSWIDVFHKQLRIYKITVNNPEIGRVEGDLVGIVNYKAGGNNDIAPFLAWLEQPYKKLEI